MSLAQEGFENRKRAAAAAGCAVEDTEFCNHGMAIRLKTGRVIARKSVDPRTPEDWVMIDLQKVK